MAVYPPPNQILSALGIEVAWQDAETLIGRTVVDPLLLNRNGAGIGMGAIAPMVDLIGGTRMAKATEGDWMATSDLWMHEREPLGPLAAGTEIEFTTSLVRSGKRTVVGAVEVLADGLPCVSCTVAFARIPRKASPHATRSAASDGEWLRLGSGPLLGESIDDACGLRVVDAPAGVVDVHRSPFVHNSIGTFQGGVMVLLADAAAVAPFGPGARVVDMQFRFLAQTGEGPATATAAVLRSDAIGSTVNVELVDSSDGTVVGLAVCRVEPSPGRPD